MTREEILTKLNDSVDGAIAAVNASIPGIQRRLLEELEIIVRDLDYTGNDISVTVKNMRVIGSISRKLRRLIMSEGYQEAIKAYLKAFSEVTTLQNAYMRSVTSEFKVTPVLKQIREQSITSTVESLTEQGLTANVADKIKDVLRRNITSGGTFRQLMQQVRETVVSTKAGEGILERYVKQITTDSINQYNRNYLQTATEATGMEWFQYTGSLIETSRCFCEAMRRKRWFHISDIPSLLKGEFPEWAEMECAMYDRTGLPQGMVAGTNASNFLTYLGGYNCGHRAVPVPALVVPIEVREALYKKAPRFRPVAEKQPA